MAANLLSAAINCFKELVLLFSPGKHCNQRNRHNNKADQDSALHIWIVQIRVKFFHTHYFLS